MASRTGLLLPPPRAPSGRQVILRGRPSGKLGEALAYQEQGDLKRAERIYRRLLDRDPANVTALHLYGLLEQQRGKPELALHLLRRAIQYAPTESTLYLNCGVVLESQKLYPQALACYRRATKLSPEDPYAWFNLGIAWGALGETAVAASCYRKVLEVDPDREAAANNLVFTLDLDETATPEDRTAARRQWDATFGTRGRALWAPHENDPDPDRPLRVGYVGSDFREHSAWLVFSGVLLGHDQSRYQPYAYSGHDSGNSAARLLADAGVVWRETRRLDDAALSAMIRADGIDVLVDLAGFTAGNRLGVFAQKPAPVQVSGWGYATGTCLSCMDGFFTDPISTPPSFAGTQVDEPLLYLPSVVSYNPPADLPDVSSLPALDGNGLMFGAFHQAKKLSTEALTRYARVLRAVPGSRMLFKHTGLDVPEMTERIRMHFEEAGIETGRVSIFGHSSHHHHVSAYADLDIQLDPSPHGGGVTTLEGLWMGIPCLTLLGESTPGRISGALMMQLGLSEWAVATDDDYVGMAVRMSQDLPALAVVRAGLRGRLAGSVICNHRLYTRSVEWHMRALWRAWCATCILPDRRSEAMPSPTSHDDAAARDKAERDREAARRAAADKAGSATREQRDADVPPASDVMLASDVMVDPQAAPAVEGQVLTCPKCSQQTTFAAGSQPSTIMRCPHCGEESVGDQWVTPAPTA